MMDRIRNTQWQQEKIVYISDNGPQVTRIFLFSTDIPSSERALRNLKDSLGERVHLKGQPHNPREQFSVMNSGTILHNFVIDS